MSGDPYIDLETGVLCNRLGITDAVELAQAESELTSYRLIELRCTGLPGRYDLAHFQAFHRYIFGDLYDWAGELRSVAIGKDDLFCLPQYLGSFAGDVFGKLARAGHLRGLERAAFIDGLTALLAMAEAWRMAHPRVLGVLLDLACAVLRELLATELRSPPRMADFRLHPHRRGHGAQHGWNGHLSAVAHCAG